MTNCNVRVRVRYPSDTPDLSTFFSIKDHIATACARYRSRCQPWVRDVDGHSLVTWIRGDPEGINGIIAAAAAAFPDFEIRLEETRCEEAILELEEAQEA